jgi:hypothetical protein
LVSSVDDWKEMRLGTSLADLAHVVLDDLLGYPAESQHRDDDAASLVNLFRVLTKRYVKPEPDEGD